MLIDDNRADNYYHERVIRNNDSADIIIAKESAEDGLAYLKTGEGTQPDIIFLDINMPGMNGWEFLEEYHLLDKQLQSKVTIVMLTTSANPDDKAKAGTFDSLLDFLVKPLSAEQLDRILGSFF